MGKARTHRKNLQKRKKQRLYAQLNHVISQNDPSQLELEYMQAEEASQRTHEKWVQANEQMDLKLNKQRKVEIAKKRLLKAIRQQMEVEEKESSDTKESTVIKKNALSMNEKSSIALMVQEAQEKAFKAMLNATTSKHLSLTTKVCTEYGRTGCCAWGDRCRRSHVPSRPGRFLLLKNMFDASWMNTREFYVDVFQELKKQNGNILRMEIAMNKVPHLLGNVYIEYKSHEEARQAFLSVKERSYAKKKIQAEIVDIGKWELLLCGASLRGACPRGLRHCHYLHAIDSISKPSVSELYPNSTQVHTPIIGFHDINAYFDRVK